MLVVLLICSCCSSGAWQMQRVCHERNVLQLPLRSSKPKTFKYCFRAKLVFSFDFWPQFCNRCEGQPKLKWRLRRPIGLSALTRRWGGLLRMSSVWCAIWWCHHDGCTDKVQTLIRSLGVVQHLAGIDVELIACPPAAQPNQMHKNQTTFFTCHRQSANTANAVTQHFYPIVLVNVQHKAGDLPSHLTCLTTVAASWALN